MTSSTFWRQAGASAAVIVVLLGAAELAPASYRYHPVHDTAWKKVVRTLHKRGLNREARDSEVAGYYEGLLDSATQYTATSGRSWFDWRRWFGAKAGHERAEAPSVERRRYRDDFLRYDLPPRLDIPDYEDPELRLVTNSDGLADREYPRDKPVGVRRVALIGDSVARGMGAPPEADFESLFEDHVNREGPRRGHARIEVLNFAVQGYNVTQFVEVALSKASAYRPDVYLLAVSERTVFRQWTEHLSALIRDRKDLKYDFLREIVRDAGVTPTMSDAIIRARLAPYRLRTLRWAIETIAAHARQSNAELMILLVPSADDPEVLIDQFTGARRLFAQLGVPTLDILDTFAYLEDMGEVRVNFADRHPNKRGHQMLFARLAQELERSPAASRILLGREW